VVGCQNEDDARKLLACSATIWMRRRVNQDEN